VTSRGARASLKPSHTLFPLNNWGPWTSSAASLEYERAAPYLSPPFKTSQAKLRREATEAAKRAGRLELELKKHERLAAHRAADVASLRAALKGGLCGVEEGGNADA
jgi:hypothetical protein